MLQKELAQHPDKDFVFYLIQGLTYGFHTGVSVLPSKSVECKNLLSATKDPKTVSELIHYECEKGYLSGPFDAPPFPIYRVSPIGLAEQKYSGKKRLIVDLSAPHDSNIGDSINGLINKEDFSLSYVKLDDAIKAIQEKGQGSLLCKLDITDAFKLMPCHPDLYHLYLIKWNKVYYFFNRLTFGSRSSPKIFDTLSQAICWIAQNNYKVTCLFHLLDDFLSVDEPNADAERTMALLTMVFHRLNIPLASHKTEGPTTILEYLGILLDTIRMEARLPPNKQARIKDILVSFLHKTTCTKRQLLSLLGHLNFACRVIRPGRTFISRIIQTSTTVKKLHEPVFLDEECQKDIQMWQYLITHWNGVSLFLENNFTPAVDLTIFTDSSGIGYGGYQDGKWFNGKWPEHMCSFGEGVLSIAYKELYPIVLAAVLWSATWARKRILFYSDNLAAVHVLQKGRSKSPAIMTLMRRLVIMAAQNSFDFCAKHIPGCKNEISDALSRFQMARFKSLAPQAAPLPCPIPSDLTPG